VHTIYASENSYLHGRHFTNRALTLAESPMYASGSLINVYGVGGSANIGWADGHVSSVPKVTSSRVFSPSGINYYWNPNK